MLILNFALLMKKLMLRILYHNGFSLCLINIAIGADMSVSAIIEDNIKRR